MSQTPDKHALEKHDVEKHDCPWRLNLHLPHLHLHHSENRPKHVSPPPKHTQPTHKPNKPLDFTKDIPTNIPYPPFVNVEGVPNVRDLGGYSCNPDPPPPSTSTDSAAGSSQTYSVRRNYAFRCSELSQITPTGDKFLTSDLNIHRLYDLRSEREAANPRGQPTGVECISTPVFRKQDVTYIMAVQQLQWGTAPDSPRNAGFSQGYVDWYRQILEYGAKSAFPIVFQHIRDRPNEPVLYHCSAGKDRTGVLSALILKLCGVDDDVVAWEYSLTVPGMGVWEEAVEGEMVGDSMMLIRSHGGMTREEARRVCGSRKGNMARFLKVVLQDEFGGAAKYLMEHCGFSEEDVKVMISNLVVPAPATVKPVDFPGYEEHSQT